MTRVLVIGGGSELQPQLREVSARAGAPVQTAVLCRASSLPHVHKPHENRTVVMLADDCPTQQWLDAAIALNDQWPVDAVASFADLDQDRAALIAAALGLSFHSLETVAWVHDKRLMRARLNDSGIENVPFSAVESLEDLQRFCRRAGLPVIVKPSRGWASSGIGVVERPEQLAPVHRRAVEADPPLVGPSAPMAERYLTGPEFSVETITHAGRHHVFAITEKFSDPQTKVELGHVVPARLDLDEQELIVEHVTSVLTVLGVRAGPTHTEVILTQEGPVVVETHLRDAGDEIPRLVQDATGIDLAEIFLRQVIGWDVGELPDIVARRDGPVYRAAGAIRYLPPPDAGTLAGIDGWDAVHRLPGVQDAQRLIPDGTRLHGLSDSFSRLAHVRVRADDASAAVTLADQAVARLAVRVRE